MKINEYVVLSGNLLANLCVDVNDYIDAGWQPYGEFYCHKEQFFQAMVRYTDAIDETEISKRFIIKTVIEAIQRNPFKFTGIEH